MFRTANPDSFFPPILQAYTKENFVFQLVLTAGIIGGIWVKETIENHRNTIKDQ
jgi:hypothetical protein